MCSTDPSFYIGDAWDAAAAASGENNIVDRDEDQFDEGADGSHETAGAAGARADWDVVAGEEVKTEITACN